jgi:hypothetical protein
MRTWIVALAIAAAMLPSPGVQRGDWSGWSPRSSPSDLCWLASQA